MENPKVGPRSLRTGSDTRPSVTKINPILCNIGVVRRVRKKDLKTSGIEGSFAALAQFAKGVHEEFIVDTKMSKDVAIVSLQTDYMRTVLEEATSGLQSDTVEGVICDAGYDGNIDIHFTSSFDAILGRWVPVLISLIFGRNKDHYNAHWSLLFNSYGPTINSSWSNFVKTFPGVTVDWSDALGFSFLEALHSHGKDVLKEESLEKADVTHFLKKCDVHFKRFSYQNY